MAYSCGYCPAFFSKKAPKWIICILWGLVTVRLICPVTLESSLSLLPSSQVIPEDITMSNNPEIHTGIPFVNNAVNPLISYTLASETGTETNLLEVIIPVISVLWMVGIVLMVLLSVYWFNPLCWITYIILCRDIEAACDEKVIQGKENIYIAAYSKALLDLSVTKRTITAWPLAFGETGVKKRVR